MSDNYETWKVIIENSGLFDKEYYLQENPDVAEEGIDPIWHYCHHGWREGRLYPNRVGSNKNLHYEQYRKINALNQLMQCLNGGNGEELELTEILEVRHDASIMTKEDGHNVDFTLTKEDKNFWITQALRDFLHFIGHSEFIPFTEAMMEVVNRSRNNREIITELPEYLDRIVKWIRLNNKAEHHPHPDVSIIIPAYNNIDLTIAAIASIIACKTKYSYEIIVADDCSSDLTPQIIPSLGSNIYNLRNKKNLGFLGNCNHGVSQSNGKYVVLLNNDVVTLPAWLDKLIEPLERDETIGLTGSKLLNSDGTLQEAGGIFWDDASAWNYGRDQDPRKPEFNYAKETDYISGASIALRKSDWVLLNGFDTNYSPAYCEDSDLAFRVREAGKKVWYTPNSALIHHEGMSHGRDVSSGTKAYQVANSEKLHNRWRDVLQRDHFPNAQNVFMARDRSRNKPHILIVDHYIPQKDKDAGSRTIYDCIRYFLSRGFQITFWPDNLNLDKQYAIELQDLGIEIIYGVDYVNKFNDWWLENGQYYDFAFLSRAHISKHYIDYIRSKHNPTVLYYGHDLAWRRLRMEYDIKPNQELLQAAIRAKVDEDTICNKSDYIIYPSKEECDYAKLAFPFAKGVVEMPAWLFEEQGLNNASGNIEKIASEAKPVGLFVGGFSHTPNLDAITWFIDEVLPLIIREIPDFKLKIIGSNMPSEILGINHPNIEAIGWVDDDGLAKHRLESGCNLVPLRTGAGVKGKVIEAFAVGLPVVSTSVGMQGIENPEQLAFVGDSSHDFARAVVDCIQNRENAKQKAFKALEFLSKNYTFNSMDGAFSAFIKT